MEFRPTLWRLCAVLEFEILNLKNLIQMNNEQNLNNGTSASMDTKPLVSSSVFRPTMKLRWSKEVFYDGSIGEYCRKLQQCYIDGTGAEHWFEVEVEGKNIAV